MALDIREVEVGSDEVAVERNGGTCDGTGAERADVDAVEAIAEALDIAIEHFDVGEEMVGEVDGLSALEVGITWDDDLGMIGGELDDRGLEFVELAAQLDQFVAKPHPHIEGDLIIPGAGRVEFGTGGHAAGQFGFDVHVNIFELRFPFEFPLLDFFADDLESVEDGLGLGLGQDPDFVQHGGMGHGAHDVVLPQTPIEGDGFGEAGDIGAGALGEATAAGDDFFGFI